MKKTHIILLALLALITSSSVAQEDNDADLVDYKVMMRVGYAPLNTFNQFLLPNLGTVQNNTNIVIAYDYFVSDSKKWSVGNTLGIVDIQTNDVEVEVDGTAYPSPIDEHFFGSSVMFKVNGHWKRSEKGSLYSGLGAGFVSGTVTRRESTVGYRDSYDIFQPAFHLTIIGSQFQIFPNVGWYSELGFGRDGLLQTGLQIQF